MLTAPGGLKVDVRRFEQDANRAIRERDPEAARLALRHYGGREEVHARWASDVLGTRDPSVPAIVLAHHPDFFPHAAKHGAALTLSGHTHGGQVGAFGRSLTGFGFKYPLGRYRLGDSHLYVSGGTGHWFPFRLGVPREVTVLTLRRA